MNEVSQVLTLPCGLGPLKPCSAFADMGTHERYWAPSRRERAMFALATKSAGPLKWLGPAVDFFCAYPSLDQVQAYVLDRRDQPNAAVLRCMAYRCISEVMGQAADQECRDWLKGEANAWPIAHEQLYDQRRTQAFSPTNERLRLLQQLADFFATQPSMEEVLAYVCRERRSNSFLNVLTRISGAYLCHVWARIPYAEPRPLHVWLIRHIWLGPEESVINVSAAWPDELRHMCRFELRLLKLYYYKAEPVKAKQLDQHLGQWSCRNIFVYAVRTSRALELMRYRVCSPTPPPECKFMCAETEAEHLDHQPQDTYGDVYSANATVLAAPPNDQYGTIADQYASPETAYGVIEDQGWKQEHVYGDPNQQGGDHDNPHPPAVNYGQHLTPEKAAELFGQILNSTGQRQQAHPSGDDDTYDVVPRPRPVVSDAPRPPLNRVGRAHTAQPLSANYVAPATLTGSRYGRASTERPLPPVPAAAAGRTLLLDADDQVYDPTYAQSSTDANDDTYIPSGGDRDGFRRPTFVRNVPQTAGLAFDPRQWETSDVLRWLKLHQLDDFKEKFYNNGFVGRQIIALRAEDFNEHGFTLERCMDLKGHLADLRQRVADIKAQARAGSQAAAAASGVSVAGPRAKPPPPTRNSSLRDDASEAAEQEGEEAIYGAPSNTLAPQVLMNMPTLAERSVATPGEEDWHPSQAVALVRPPRATAVLTQQEEYTALPSAASAGPEEEEYAVLPRAQATAINQPEEEYSVLPTASISHSTAAVTAVQASEEEYTALPAGPVRRAPPPVKPRPRPTSEPLGSQARPQVAVKPRAGTAVPSDPNPTALGIYEVPSNTSSRHDSHQSSFRGETPSPSRPVLSSRKASVDATVPEEALYGDPALGIQPNLGNDMVGGMDAENPESYGEAITQGAADPEPVYHEELLDDYEHPRDSASIPDYGSELPVYHEYSYPYNVNRMKEIADHDYTVVDAYDYSTVDEHHELRAAPGQVMTDDGVIYGAPSSDYDPGYGDVRDFGAARHLAENEVTYGTGHHEIRVQVPPPLPAQRPKSEQRHRQQQEQQEQQQEGSEESKAPPVPAPRPRPTPRPRPGPRGVINTLATATPPTSEDAYEPLAVTEAPMRPTSTSTEAATATNDIPVEETRHESLYGDQHIIAAIVNESENDTDSADLEDVEEVVARRSIVQPASSDQHVVRAGYHQPTSLQQEMLYAEPSAVLSQSDGTLPEDDKHDGDRGDDIAAAGSDEKEPFLPSDHSASELASEASEMGLASDSGDPVQETAMPVSQAMAGDTATPSELDQAEAIEPEEGHELEPVALLDRDEPYENLSGDADPVTGQVHSGGIIDDLPYQNLSSSASGQVAAGTLDGDFEEVDRSVVIIDDDAYENLKDDPGALGLELAPDSEDEAELSEAAGSSSARASMDATAGMPTPPPAHLGVQLANAGLDTSTVAINRDEPYENLKEGVQPHEVGLNDNDEIDSPKIDHNEGYENLPDAVSGDMPDEASQAEEAGEAEVPTAILTADDLEAYQNQEAIVSHYGTIGQGAEDSAVTPDMSGSTESEDEDEAFVGVSIRADGVYETIA
ncbi:uncharacterized protein MONBRDRAFT_39221 [Monosiga brevicollis MX1]|uniref:SAM domain-containing protein n=1 Tax=Monosiga brevicollis TaxID=81824 RepID=A9VD01_MONBE|nr:uncharacterized protein MONBRDRAFT_39221 [Monosiga brevicollis MX1]EDQ84591.1 predicted protein [Monosiga brevicollis MX1]|eukprot:XP_001750618.1 hypothetical protein [Monosiga brevicollis MX1]